MGSVFADTSFLFSLFGDDSHTATAQAWIRKSRVSIAISALGRYEFGNAVRFAVFRKAITTIEASASLSAFEADVKAGYLHLVSCDWTAIIAAATRLSELHTLSGGHRSFDILHVATATLAETTTFLTFDVNQGKLATAAGLRSAPSRTR